MYRSIIDVGLLGKDSGVSYLITAPYDLVLKDVIATAAIDDIGDADTVTVSEDSDTLGVATFGSDIAAGAKATYVADTTNGEKVVQEGDTVTIAVSALGASTSRVFVQLEVDPFCRTTQ